MKIKIDFNAKKVLEFGTVKITLRTITPIVNHYIQELSILAAQETNLDRRLELSREYVKRVICCTVEKIEGVDIEVEDKQFQLSFKEQSIQELDDMSYNVLMHIFENVLKHDLALDVFNHYLKKEKTDIEVEEDKKKDL